MPIDLINFLIDNTIKNSKIVFREQLIDLIKRYNVRAYKHLSVEIQLDHEILKIIFINDSKNIIDNLKWAPNVLKNDQKFLLEAIKVNENVIGFVNSELLKNMNFIYKMVMINPKTIPYVLDQFKIIYNNKKHEFEDIIENHNSNIRKQNYQEAAKTLKINKYLKEFINGSLEKISINEIITQNEVNESKITLNPEFKLDKNEVINFYKTYNNDTLQLGNTEDDKNYFKYSCLIYMSELYSNDPELVIAYLKSNKFSIYKENHYEYILSNLSDRLKDNINVAKAFLENKPEMIAHFGEDVKNNYEIAEIILKEDGNLLKYLSIDLRKNINLIKIAVKNNSNAIFNSNLDMESENYLEIVLIALENDPDIILYMNNKIKEYDKVKNIIMQKKPILYNTIYKYESS